MKGEVRKGKHLCGRELNSFYFTVLFYRFYDAVPNDTVLVSKYYLDGLYYLDGFYISF